MKLLRYGEPGPNVTCWIRTATSGDGVVDDIAGQALSPAGLARLAAIDPASLPRAATPCAWDHRSRARASSSASV